VSLGDIQKRKEEREMRKGRQAILEPSSLFSFLPSLFSFVPPLLQNFRQIEVTIGRISVH
jgi:hypothetical protein